MKTRTKLVTKWMPVLKKLHEASEEDWSKIAAYLEASFKLFHDVGDFTHYVLPHLRKLLAKKKPRRNYLRTIL